MSGLLQRIDSLGRRPWVIPAGLLLAILLAHGVLVPSLGFFWDDFPTAWFDYLRGPGVYWKVYADVRPVLSWVYMLTTPWLGWQPLGWQLFGLFARWLSVLAAWGFLRNLWPGRRREAALIALMLALYPGFKQGPIPIIYSHFFLLLALSCLSLTLMIRAMRSGRRRWGLTALSVFAAGLSVFATEYFAGLELLRPLVLWMVIGQEGLRGRRRLRGTLLAWFPYAILLLAYLVWRVWIFEFPSYQPTLLEGLRANVGSALGLLTQFVLRALETATLGAWGQVLNLPVLSEVGRRVMLGYALVVLGSAALALITLVGSRRSMPDPESVKPGRWWPIEAIVFGVVAMLAGGLPIWVTQLPVDVDYPWDRMTLPLMLGACVLLVGVLELVVHPVALRLGIAAALLGLSAGVHFRSGVTYARDWEGLGAFLWQLSWRVPDLAKGTTVLANDIPLLYYSDNSLTAPLNWMYSPENHSLQMDYMLYYPTVRVGLGLTRPLAGLPIRQAYRAASFEGSTSQLLALFYDPPGCVHVLDVLLDDSMPNLPASLSTWVPLSRLDLIQTQASRPRTPPWFPNEPAHNWCYYFEKADLARQMGDWQAVADLGDQAFAVDHPNDASERLVFIEGYARTGRWDRAEELSVDALEHNPAVDRMVCHTWNRIVAQVEPGMDGKDAAARIRARARCGSG